MAKRSVSVFLLAVFLIMAAVVPAAAAENKAAITVTGHAETTVTPDVAMITTGIVTTGPDVESARNENNRVMTRIIDSLATMGIDRSKITTSQFYLQPVQRTDRDGGNVVIDGYRLQNNVTVVVEDLGKTGQVIDAAFKAGANQFHSLRFGLKDDSKLREELLKKAVQDGRRKASTIAEALGVSLGQPLSVSEAGSFAPVQADAMRVLKAGAPGTPIEAGSITLGIDVNIVFAM